MTKHYIRLDDKNRLIKGFSTDFEEPLEGDVSINENAGRHFELDGEVNPSLISIKGIYIYKYENGQIIKRTEEEIKADEISVQIPKTEIEILKENQNRLQTVIDELLMGVVYNG